MLRAPRKYLHRRTIKSLSEVRQILTNKFVSLSFFADELQIHRNLEMVLLGHVRFTGLEHLRLEHRALLGHGHLFSLWLVAEIKTDRTEMLLKCTHARGRNVSVNTNDEHTRSCQFFQNFLERPKLASSTVTR